MTLLTSLHLLFVLRRKSWDMVEKRGERKRREREREGEEEGEREEGEGGREKERERETADRAWS